MKHEIYAAEPKKFMLDEVQISSYHENGYVILPQFYDVVSYVRPLMVKIYALFKIIIDFHKLPIEWPNYSQHNFDSVYLKILKTDRKLASIIYDAVKQMPEFVRITSSYENQQIAEILMGSHSVAIAGAGSGIRINNPEEPKYLAGWHQEYPAQLRSPDGLVFWSPLVPITPDIGPVVVLPKSQNNGIYPIEIMDNDAPTAYRLKIANEENIVALYEQVAPLVQPGDLIVMNFLTLHRSGYNVLKDRALWSMQFRYFNFENNEGLKHGYTGSYVSGVNFEDIYPEYIIK